MTVWLARGGAKSLGGAPEAEFIVSGHSAAAHNAAVIAHLALHQKLCPPVTGSFIMMSNLLVGGTVPKKYKNIWRSKVENDGGEAYDVMHATWPVDTARDTYDPLFSPINMEGTREGFVQLTSR